MMARLEEICAINMGQSPDSSTYNEDGNGLPFFQGNADFGEIYPAVRMWCSEPTKIAREKDILISVRAPIGALNIANCECCIGRGLAALAVNEDICAQEYLWHALSGKVDELNSKGTGSTFKAINKKTLSETEIPLPPIDEQRKIAAVLDKVSDLIAKRQQQLDKLDEAVKARFVEIFGEPDENPKHWQEDELSHHLKVIQAKEQIGAWIKPYLSSSLKYDVYDFSYQTSEYEALEGKQFQMLFVEDTPQFLPFISRKEGSSIKPATIYIRCGTSDEQVTEEELSHILERRMKHIFPVTGKPLVLEEHLEQLKILYNHIEPTISKIKNPENIPFVQALKTFAELARGITGGYEYETEKNPLYPEESYEQFIAALIDKKKKKIERVLDLQ